MLSAVWGSTFAGAAPLTENRAVALALARPAFVGLGEGRIAEADAAIDEARRWPNPEFEYAREQTDGTPDVTEEFYTLHQRFDVSGRRGLQVEAARSAQAAVTAEQAAQRRELVAEVRDRFYGVLYHQERLRASEEWARRLADIEASVVKREEAGDVSGYDRRRLTQERRAAETRLRELQAAQSLKWERLRAVLGISEAEADRVEGDLAAPALPPLSDVLARLPHRPDLAALRLQAESFELQRRAAARGWIPDVTVGLGTKRVEQGALDESGVILSASVPLPLFDRREPARQRAAAQAQQARNTYDLALAEAEGNIRGLWQEVATLNETLGDVQGTAVPEAQALIRIAEAAYRGGELGILELLDAYRGLFDAQRRVLDLKLQARQSRIALERASGEMTP